MNIKIIKKHIINLLKMLAPVECLAAFVNAESDWGSASLSKSLFILILPPRVKGTLCSLLPGHQWHLHGGCCCTMCCARCAHFCSQNSGWPWGCGQGQGQNALFPRWAETWPLRPRRGSGWAPGTPSPCLYCMLGVGHILFRKGKKKTNTTQRHS